jgi:hypothetical protein
MRPLCLATIALALAAASCGGYGDGGMSQAEYERRLQGLSGLFGGDACEVPDPEEAVEARLVAVVERLETLAEIDPPEEVVGAHVKLLVALAPQVEALGVALDRVGELPDPAVAETRDAQAHAVAAGFEAADRAAPDPPELAEARQAFAEAGYEVEPPPLEPDAYEARTNELVARLSPIAIAGAATTGELQAEAERVGLELLDRARELEEIVPPPPVAEAHEHLVLGVCARAQELVLFGRFGGVDPNEPAPTDTLRQVIATLDPFFEEAAGDYADRGYDVTVPEVEADRGR